MLGMRDIRKGRAVVLEGEPYIVVSAEFLRKQKGRPVVRSLLGHLSTGKTREHTFMQADKVEEASIERAAWQFLYHNGAHYVFMNSQTYDQTELDQSVVGETGTLLLEGQSVEVVLFEGSVVAVELPIKIERKVESAPPGIKGNTSSNVMKEVVIEGGVKIKAPLFVKTGDVIRIDTRTREYVERA
jgi:elongation factor P